jgi:hypothetical protein
MTAAPKAWKGPFTQAVRRCGRPTRAERRSGSRFLIRAGRFRTATPATSSMPTERTAQRHERRQDTTPSGAGATTAARIACRHRSPRGPVCSAGRSAQRASLSPPRLTSTWGETDPRVWLNDYRLACQLGGATTDEVIICNLPLHLADSARTWLKHLPPSQIHNWDDLVRTFVGNFQGTYVHLGNSWDLQACTQKPGESLRDFIRRFSKRCTELPSVASPRSCTPFSRARPAGTSCASSGVARRSTPMSCSTSPPTLLPVRRRWGPSSTARKASVWMTCAHGG